MVKITSDDVKISGITVNGSNSYDGIQINANNSSLYNIKCMESISGLIINGSSDNSEINRSIFDSNSIGIYMDEMSTNTDIIDNRIISNTNYAISMNDNIEYIIIGNNLITGNDVAFKYNNVNNIEIYFNKIVSDTKNIELSGTNTNIKYNSTTQKQYEFDDTTYQSYVGNFWGPKYTIVDDNHDGINDSSITLDNGIDYYPLVDYPYPAYSKNTSFVPSTNIITVGEPIEFDDTSTTYLASYVWNFGDGTESNIPGSAAHIYDTPGTYDVTLTTTSYTGVVQEYTEQVQVIPRPVADFNANVTTGYEPLSVQFTSTSSNTVSYEWDFGDGTTSTSENPTHVYTGHDVYTVSLTAQNSEGIEDTETKELYIKVMDPEYENNDTITSYSWDFGDGNTSTDESPIHTYDIGTQVSDTYTVTFTATNDLGVTRSITKDVTVYHNPVSDFITFAEDSGNMIVHKDITFDPTTPQYTDTHDWDIQNNSYSIQTVTDIVYDKAGTFIESLYVNNTHTAESNTHEYVIITGIDCDVSYTPDSGDVPLSVDFTASLTNATDNEHLSYEWNFGDGSTSTTTGLTESHTYSDPGSYIVSMDVVHDTYGIICSYTDTQYIEVYEVEPDAMFYVDPGVGNETTTEFQFTDASTGNPYAWYWTFGDGTTSTEQNPTHIYNDAGEYTVTLTVYNDISTDSYTRTIQVWDTENDNKKAMYTEYVPYVERTDDLMYWQSGNDSDEPVDKELEPGESVTLTIQIPELDHITNNVTSNWVKITTPNGVSRSGYFDWY
jgi:PKD repeat protein